MSFLDDELREITSTDMVRFGVGRTFWHASIDKIPDGAAYKEKLRTYLRGINTCVDQGIGLFLFGPLRSGKTSAATIVAKHVIGHNGTAFFIRANEITSAVVEKKAFDENETVEERMRSVDLLVIDDLGQEHSKEFGRDLVESFVRNRYDNKRSLIVTSNVTREELIKKYSESMVLVLESRSTPIKIEGVNWYEKEVMETQKVLETVLREGKP